MKEQCRILWFRIRTEAALFGIMSAEIRVAWSPLYLLLAYLFHQEKTASVLIHASKIQVSWFKVPHSLVLDGTAFVDCWLVQISPRFK